MNKESDELYLPDDPAEEAFTQSDAHELGELELQPYTPDRAVAVVLWLCSLTNQNEIDKASRDPIAAARRAIEWLHERKMDNTRSEEFWKAYTVFMRIMSEVDASASVPEHSDNGTADPKA